LSGIDTNLQLLESNLAKQQRLLMSLSVAESSLTTLKGLYSEQSVLVMSLMLWAAQPGERLSVSDQSLAWATEDVALLEASLARERANSARLGCNARVWRTAALVVGVLALSAGVAALVW
jgi:hypothetical protein